MTEENEVCKNCLGPPLPGTADDAWLKHSTKLSPCAVSFSSPAPWGRAEHSHVGMQH